MTGKRIAELDPAAELADGDAVPVDQADGTRRTSVAALRRLTKLDAGTTFVEPDNGGVVVADVSGALVHLVSAYGGAVEYRLPAASSCPGRVLSVKKTDPSAHAVTVTEAGATGPDNEAIVLSSFGHAVMVASNGARWHILAVNGVPREHPQPWSTVTDTPHTLAGYGVQSVGGGLADAGGLTGAELVALDQGGVLKRATVADIRRAGAPVPVPYAAEITLDFAAGPDFVVAPLTGPVRFLAPQNATPGRRGLIRLEQGERGGVVPEFSAGWRGGTVQVAGVGGEASLLSYRVLVAAEIVIKGVPMDEAHTSLSGEAPGIWYGLRADMRGHGGLAGALA